MLATRVALITLPLTLALAQAALASSVTLLPLTPRTQVAGIGASCANPVQPARTTTTFLQYPSIAKETGREGVADVGIELSATGQLVKAWPIQSSGDPNLDRAALESARASRYAPERANCAAVAGSYLMEVDFSL